VAWIINTIDRQKGPKDKGDMMIFNVNKVGEGENLKNVRQCISYNTINAWRIRHERA